MALTIVTLEFHYGGCFVSDPTLRYANEITSVEKINIDVDGLYIMLFHKIALELVNKKSIFYILNTDSDVLNFLNGLKGADFVDVYVVHLISIPLVVEEILVLPSTNADVSSSPQKDNKNAAVETNAATSNVATGTSDASAATSNFTNVTIRSQLSVNIGPSAGCTPSAGLSARRPTNASSSGVRPATALESGGRPTSATSSDVRQLSTQQSTFSAADQKRKTSTTLKGGKSCNYSKAATRGELQKHSRHSRHTLDFTLFSLMT
ncbi:hypothetical protein R3W88_002603 [Solanum pinnatisectum]|uniref:Uncharacterized protein n=1 Tax=Solanum pinnatisectum TaxID=50273 RepID=A0AAV9MLY1_9SOLN|nr:hypothetical protein R3W88_002603 [Solanum pinnatisectum]